VAVFKSLLFLMGFPLLVLSLIFSPGLASANEKGADNSHFISTIRSFRQHCSRAKCESPYSVRKIQSLSEGLFPDKELYRQLSEVALDQTQIWDDTILEGDYYASGQTHVDQILALYENSELIGYYMTYSERAWDTSQCHFDPKKNESLKFCPVGQISESSYVSPALSSFFVDEDQFAEFRVTE
jgi:hypothetical protein